jgi:hypothetical protein
MLAKKFERQISRRIIFLVLLAVVASPATCPALPARLVLALDGVAYRDLKALQAGITVTNFWGKPVRRQAFRPDEGYFPVSRMISTFPSASDVAWTDIFGDRPLPGYQRTYFSTAADLELTESGVATSVEHERQMDWQMESSFLRAMAYLYPIHIFKYELHELGENFFAASPTNTSFYAYIRSSDDAQHMGRDIFELLCQLDRQLQAMRARYLAQTGRELQIVILSDHGHNHAGRGQRVEIRAFLERAGYHIAHSIKHPKDVVLPTAGIETWVEIHNAPAETDKLTEQLCHLEGADILAARLADQTNRFLVMNSKSERAVIDWNPVNNSFRYAMEKGDPLDYRPVVDTLARTQQIGADGFAAADAWMQATLTHHYPLALERIVRSFTRNNLNPATILISLDNHYVNDSWLVQNGSRLVTCSSTHGGLDDACSDGILLSSFTPTQDTSTVRVAGQFQGFPDLKDFRAGESGAEWVTKSEQSLTRVARVPFDREISQLPDVEVCLRIWSPRLAGLESATPIEAAIEKISQFSSVQIRRSDPKPAGSFKRHLIFNQPVLSSGNSGGDRVYVLPPGLDLEPQTEYKITGWILDQKKTSRLFAFNFYTGSRGRPAVF